MRVSGTVIRGDGRGRLLGFPTANISPESVHELEAGVYAGYATTEDNRIHLAAIHIGPRPTFEGAKPTTEAHLLDFDEMIYDTNLTLDIKHKLRDIEKFDTIEALQEAIQNDCTKVRSTLTL